MILQEKLNLITKPQRNERIVFFNNKYIITGGSDAVLSIFNISVKIVQSVNMGRNNFILSIDLSQRNQLAVGSYTTLLSLYNVIGDKPDFVSRW